MWRDNECRGYSAGGYRGEMGELKHAILRNEANLCEGKHSRQHTVNQVDTWILMAIFEGAILKNEANFERVH
jgi:hypothetical protein